MSKFLPSSGQLANCVQMRRNPLSYEEVKTSPPIVLIQRRSVAILAQARKEPIPFYAEMGSVNPVFILPGAASERAEAIAQQYVPSVTLGTGQFCTNPGLLIGLEGAPFDTLRSAAKKAAEEAQAATMLHQGIFNSYESGLQRLEQIPGVTPLASSAQSGSGTNQAPCHLLEAEVHTLLAQPELKEENFGPCSVLLKARTAEQLEQAAEAMEGQLTATIHGTEADLEAHGELITILQRKVGRLIFNGFPTGIEVCPSMHHGGPYPATTHGGFTSIGTASIERFVRPVCYQGFPENALPPELKNKNERGILRLVNNGFKREDVD